MSYLKKISIYISILIGLAYAFNSTAADCSTEVEIVHQLMISNLSTMTDNQLRQVEESIGYALQHCDAGDDGKVMQYLEEVKMILEGP